MSETQSALMQTYGVSLDPQDYIKRMSVMVYLMTFLFLYASMSSALLAEPGVYYLLLLLTLLSIGYWVEQTGEEVFPREHFKIVNVPHQVAGGMMLASGYLIMVVILGTVTPRGGDVPIESFVQTMILMVAVVGMVEVVMQIVYVRIVYLGILIFPFLFAFTHPQIAPYWTKGIVTPESLTFFIYAVCQAFVFIGIFLARDYFKPKDIEGNPLEGEELEGKGTAYKYFGAVSVATYHGSINAISVFALVLVGGVAL